MTTAEYLSTTKKLLNCESPEEKSQLLEKVKKFNKDLLEKYPWLTPFNNWSGKKITDCIRPNGEEGFWPGDPEKHPDYDYEYTLLDNMPDGWRIAFGDQMCEEIDRELRRFDYQDKYRIVQIKEKYGSLRWYDNGTPFKLSDIPVKEFTKKGNEVLDKTWDSTKYYLKSLWSDHYISIFDKNIDMTREEIDEYNKNAIHHYALYEVVDTCKVPDIIYKYTELSRHICINCGKTAKWLTTGWISPYCDDCKRATIEAKHFDESSFERLKEDNI